MRPSSVSRTDSPKPSSVSDSLVDNLDALFVIPANAGISAQLTEMLVVRAEKEYYEKLDCRESSPRGEWEIANDGSRAWRTEQFDAYINEVRRKEIVEAHEQRLYDLQDDVDAFNATHSLEVVA